MWKITGTESPYCTSDCTNLHLVIILYGRGFSPYLMFPHYILLFSMLIVFICYNRVILGSKSDSVFN